MGKKEVVSWPWGRSFAPLQKSARPSLTAMGAVLPTPEEQKHEVQSGFGGTALPPHTALAHSLPWGGLAACLYPGPDAEQISCQGTPSREGH